MTRAQAITAAATGKMKQSLGVAQGSVVGFGAAATRAGRDTTRSFTQIGQAASVIHGPLGGVASRFRSYGQLLQSTNAAMAVTAVILSGIGFGSFAFVKLADRAKLMSNQLKTVTKDSADLAAVQQKLFEVAQRTRSSFEATTTIYARTARATESFGLSQEKLLRITETVQKAFAIGGASTQEAQGAAIQLSQGIASDRFSGDEFRSVAENAPVLLRGIAESIGVTVGKLREMAHAGELTARVVTNAILKSSTRIDSEFAKTEATVGQGFDKIGNALLRYVGAANASYGVTNNLSASLSSLAENFDAIAQSITTVAAAALVFAGGRLARSVGVIGGLAGAAGGAFLGNELGGLTGALVGGVAGGALGLRIPTVISNIRLESKTAAEQVRGLKTQVVDLRKEFLAAGQARSTAIQAARGDPTLAASKSLQGQFRGAALRPTASISDIQAARAAAAADGQKRLAAEVTRTTGVYKHFGTQLRDSNVQLVAATRVATVASQAKAFLGRSVSSLVGLFGGPWGLAITGAIALLGHLALKAQRTAQEMAEAERIISEILSQQAEAGDQAAADSVLEGRVRALEENKRALAEYLNLLKSSGPLFRNPFASGSFGELVTPYQVVRDEINLIIDRLAEGQISVTEFKARMESIKEASPSFAGVADEAIRNADKIRDQALAVTELTKQVKELEALVSRPMELRFKIAFDGVAGDEQRFPTAGAFSEFARERAANTNEIVKGLNAEIGISRLKAKGLNAEAEAQGIVNKALEEGKYISYDVVLAKVKEKQALDETAAALKKAGTAAETLAQKLARMKSESKGAFLPDIDREVLQQARSLKLATSEMEAYIRAAQSGDFSKAPPRLVELRDQILYDQAAESSRGVVQQYGLWAQIAPLAAAKQRELSMAVAEGAITATQAKFAYADYLGQFENNRWIGEATSAFGDFIKTGLDGWDSLKDGAVSFLTRIRDLIAEMLVIEPLMRSLRAGFAGGASGGGGFFGSIASLFGGGQAVAQGGGVGIGPTTLSTLYHGGGRVGDGGLTRRVSSGAFVGATRLHTGLRSDERAAIFRKGEQVLTDRMAASEARTVAGLSAMAGRGGGGMEVNIYNQAPGVTAEATPNDSGGLDVLIRQVEGHMAKSVATNGPLGKAIGNNFVKRKPK